MILEINVESYRLPSNSHRQTRSADDNYWNHLNQTRARRGQATYPQDEPVDSPLAGVRGLTTAPRPMPLA